MRHGRFLAAVSVLGLAALVGLPGSPRDASAQARYVIRWAHFAPPEQPAEKGALWMAKNVKERTKGQIEIRTFPASQLGSLGQQLEQLQAGTIQMMYSPGPVLAAMEQEWAVVDAPFAFESEEHMRAFLRSDLVKEMSDRLLQKRGIRMLDPTPIFGARHVSTKTRPVRRPEDLKGLKIRVFQAAARADMIRAWGGEPVVTPTAEMYLAMQTGLADGQESPLSWQADNKYWEVQKYVSLTGHIMNDLGISINEKFFQGLPADLRQMLEEETHRTADYVTDLYKKENEAAKAKLKAQGMIIIEDVDRAAFRKASEAMWTKWEDSWGKGMVQKIIHKQFKQVMGPGAKP